MQKEQESYVMLQTVHTCLGKRVDRDCPPELWLVAADQRVVLPHTC